MYCTLDANFTLCTIVFNDILHLTKSIVIYGFQPHTGKCMKSALSNLTLNGAWNTILCLIRSLSDWYIPHKMVALERNVGLKRCWIVLRLNSLYIMQRSRDNVLLISVHRLPGLPLCVTADLNLKFAPTKYNIKVGNLKNYLTKVTSLRAIHIYAYTLSCHT